MKIYPSMERMNKGTYIIKKPKIPKLKFKGSRFSIQNSSCTFILVVNSKPVQAYGKRYKLNRESFIKRL